MATYTNEDIVRYVEGELSSEEKQKMEDDLRTDAALAESVALYRQLKGTLEQRLPAGEGAAALRRTLGDMRGKYFAGAGIGAMSPGAGSTAGKVVNIRVRVFRRYVAGLAAAAAILFAVVMLWPSDYLNTYGKTQMAGVTERGEGSDTLMEKASVFFNSGAFDKALPLLDQAYRADTANQTALFYRGVARLHAGIVVEARQDLQAVYRGESLFKYEAAFYMALSYLEKGDKEMARSWIEKVPADAPDAEKADALRKKLW
ncbi:MAG TPA: hypothetical protein VGM31_03585 [Puia sp.]|jgi:tetratricopeptide (TPR) repeat protein